MTGRRFKFSHVLMRFRRAVRNDQLILSILAVIVGALAAGGTVLLREGISLVQSFTFGPGSEDMLAHLRALPWWQILLAPALGGLLVGRFIEVFMPGGKPLGVAHAIEAGAVGGGHMPLGAGIGAAIASAASIGVGASVGREGPAVHIGATLGAWLANRLHLTRSLSRTLLGCGAAAAVAASFNAPIAGALFAHEVIVGHYALSAFAPIVIASVVGTIISRGYYGDFPAFTIVEHPGVSIFEFPAIVGLGIACGIFAIILMRAVALTEDGVAKLRVPQWVRPGIGGLAVGAIALAFPEVMGVGYEATDLALKVGIPLTLLVALVFAKTAATAISLGTGFGGGVFSPSLMIGAMLGCAYGIIATSVAPGLSSGPGAYTIIGMGGLAAAVLGAPISTTLIVFELTADYTLTIAVMVAVVIASVITQQFFKRSFFYMQLERDGLDLKGGFETALLRNIKVRSILSHDEDAVSIDTGLAEVRRKLQDSRNGELFVLRGDDELYGTITLADLSEVAFDPAVDNLINAGDVARLHPPAIDADDHLESANKLIRDTGEPHIAVIDNHENLKFLGILHERDLMAAYNRALMEAREEARAGTL
jgi:CIC family chloride channel protein